MNTSTLEIKVLAKSLLEDPEYLANLKARLRYGCEPAAVVVTLYHYAYGQPTHKVDVTLKASLEDIVAGGRKAKK